MSSHAALIAFLRARIDEDEQISQAACVPGDLFVDFAPEDDGQSQPGRVVLLAHIGNWDPMRALAEVEVKRRIMELCEDAIEAGKLDPNTTWNDDAKGAVVGEEVLRIMVQSYVNHPDYDPAWAPNESESLS